MHRTRTALNQVPASNRWHLCFLEVYGGIVIKAVIFDIDGTLVESVDVHAMAWQESLAKFGFASDYEKVRAQIGKGGDKLIPEFVPKEQLESVQQKLADFRGDL